MNDQKTIVTITLNPSIDINTQTDKVTSEQKLRCESPRYEPGGGGINVSRAIKKLEGESLAMFSLGGTNGEMLKQLLKKESINLMPVEIGAITRENLTVYENSSGEQYRFVMPGPEIGESEWKKYLDEIENMRHKADYIVISGSLPPGVPEHFYARIAKLGKEIEARVLVDTKGAALKRAVEEGVYMIKVNVREFNDIHDEELDSEEQIIGAAQRILDECGCSLVVITLGSAGAIVVSQEGSGHFRSPTVPIRSKVGAGDSMMAGIVLALARGRKNAQAVKYGVAAGAAAVMTPGTELCRKEDTERLFKQISSEDIR
ncbi:MAG TPA: 1-phosphofructokinase family hexose kinase [candidate division Zixibacteria bacterium]|nr:1-phosphofructokinase family hexose kinase [candidate division Zixibacteria bacterium]